MNVRAVVVDDEAPARRRMKKLLATKEDIEVLGEAENGTEAIAVIERLRPNLIFLDIQLKDKTGFEVLQKLPTYDFVVVFITAYDQYAIQAFEENAVDYLLKPYKDGRFFEALDRARLKLEHFDLEALKKLMEQLLSKKSGRIQVPEGRTTHLIEEDQLLYIKADGYYCHFYFEHGNQKIIRISLKQLEKLLPAQMLRINRSIIINKQKIEALKQRKKSVELVLVDGTHFITEKRLDL